MHDTLITTAVLPAALGVIMLILGLSLTPTDFRRVAVKPRGVAIGMLNLAVVSPLLAFGIAELYGLPPELAVGLVLLGASPGGVMANVLTHFSRGDTALSITMTALSSVASVVTVPLYLELSASHFAGGSLGEVEMPGVVARVFAITILPISVGMLLRARRPERVQAAYATLRWVALGVFGVVIVGAIVAEHQTVIDNIAEVGAAALTLNVAAMSISFTVARLARLDDRQSTAIALELGIHNSALAITVGATLAAAVSVPAAVYSAFMFITGLTFARVMYLRIGERDEGSADPSPAYE